MRIRTAALLITGFFLAGAAISQQAKAETNLELCLDQAAGNDSEMVACYGEAIQAHTKEIVALSNQIKPQLSQPEAGLLETTGQAYQALLAGYCPLQGAAHISKADLLAGISTPEARLVTLDCQLKVLRGAVGDLTELLASLKASGGHR